MGRRGPSEAAVQLGSGSDTATRKVLIVGRPAVNRAVHGDTVAVRLLPRRAFSTGSNMIGSSTQGLTAVSRRDTVAILCCPDLVYFAQLLRHCIHSAKLTFTPDAPDAGCVLAKSPSVCPGLRCPASLASEDIGSVGAS